MRLLARRLLLTISALLAIAPLPVTGQGPRPMTLVDLLNVPQLSDPQLSPDGRYVAYVLAEANWKSNRRISHIWRAALDGSHTTQMTNGAEGERSPRWSPDGKKIAFLARRGSAGQRQEDSDSAEAQTQIHLIGADGGEARALTAHETSVSDFAWAPDGRTIYFVAEDPKSEDEKRRAKAKDDVYAFDENYKQQHLWTVDVPTSTAATAANGGDPEASARQARPSPEASARQARTLPEAPARQAETRLTEGDYSILDFAISSDGRRIAFHRGPSPLFGDGDRGEVWVMDATGGNARQLTRNTVPESNAMLSPDGTQVLFLAQANERFDVYYNRRIFVVSASGGHARAVTSTLPYEVERATWSPDGRSIFVTANTGVESQLLRVPAEGGLPEALTKGQHSITGWSFEPKANRHVVSINAADNAGDLWTIPGGGGAPARVTHVFDYLAREFSLPRQERVEWKGADGAAVDGLLFYPLDYRQGQRYPLVVQTHGGPQASDKFGFGRWGNYVQVLTAMGYAVLQPNYRGSTGYGDAFLRDMVGSYFKNSHLDVMTGVDHVIKMGVADGSRLVKMGWSGGGHMTNKIITFTDRFKAASSGAGAANWVSMYAQSDVRTYRTPWFGGTPWQKDAPIDLYWEHSPLKQVANVKTPTIFLVGERDPRVPMPQSVEMYRALKSNGVPTRLYVAPREPHGWQELRHELFKMNVELDWFEKHARGRTYTWQQAPEEKQEKLERGQTPLPF
ncbi:MAG TPA: S9 family peptidase [Vicinamibacterales bacterium]|nr:S9 family peptidase [Vicinamibacterales bacterium]